MLSVDVRDVALAHVKALTAEPGTLRGERILLQQKEYWFREMMKIISEKFYPAGLTNVATSEVPNAVLQALALVDSQVKLVAQIVGLEVQVDNSKSMRLLDMKYERDLDTSIIEMVESMMHFGVVEASTGRCSIF